MILIKKVYNILVCEKYGVHNLNIIFDTLCIMKSPSNECIKIQTFY